MISKTVRATETSQDSFHKKRPEEEEEENYLTG
jgi:hypothetical protein